MIEGIADGVAGVARFAGGALADDPAPAQRTAVGGYTSTAIFSSLIGVATAAWQVGVLRSARLGGARAARSGAQRAARRRRAAAAYGRAYGFERAMDNLGAIGGPLLAIGLVALLGVRKAILVSFVPGALAAVAIVVAIRLAPRLAERERRPLRIRVRPVLQRTARPADVRASPRSSSRNVAATLLILRTAELLNPGESYSRTAIVLYAGYNLAATLIAIPAGQLSDRRGSTIVLVLGAVAFAGAFAGFAFAGASIALLAFLFVVAGLGIGVGETAQSAAVAAFAPVDLRGSRSGSSRPCRPSPTSLRARSPASSGHSSRRRPRSSTSPRGWSSRSLASWPSDDHRPVLPAKRAALPSSSSMRSSRLYFAARSERAGAPALMKRQPVATARSAIVVSSVSPERCAITAV